MSRRLLLIAVLLIVTLSPGFAQSDFTDALQNYLDSQRDPDDPAVAIAVWTPDATYSAATGVVELDGDPATVDSRFRLGSVSKTYTAVVILQLVEQGLIDLDAPISDYLPPEVIDDLNGAADVTTRQLLTMTSGLPEYLADEFYDAVDSDPSYTWTPLDALTFAYGEPSTFAPGTDFEYTNTNYLLLQLIAENVTGEPLHVLVRTGILDPVDAGDTYTQIQETLPREFVHGYEDLDGDGTPEDTFAINDGAGMGDGALIATASDVTLFYVSLFYDGDLLDPATLDEMLTDPIGSEYGMGVDVLADEDYGTIYGHGGSVYGFTSIARYFADEEVIVVILHADDDIDEAWVYEIVDMLLDA